VAYVPIQPVWDGFQHPVDVIAGYDELLYVVDDLSEEIIAMDQAGNELGRFAVPGVHTVAMDRTLDLLAVGTFDTLGTTLSCVYRIEMKNGSSYGIRNATIENKILHPFYYKSTFSPGVDDQAVITGIAVRANNQYFMSRTGPGNSAVFGPDDAVVIMDNDDEFITTVRVNTNGGIFNDYFRAPVSIASVAQPPQSPFVSVEGDFVFCSLSATTQLKVQYIDVTETDNGTDYAVKEMVVDDTSQAEGFLYSPARFGTPVDVTYTGDGTNYMFVVDSEKDSLYQFSNTGLEGVTPPAGSSSDKNILVSFGGSGTGLTEFNDPSGVAYYDQIVYVADAGNGRILRFKLTTDFD
ncbi:MAG: hypothetical protein AAF570_16955, partial [Bacteroidota bacterium]